MNTDNQEINYVLPDASEFEKFFYTLMPELYIFGSPSEWRIYEDLDD